MCVLGGAGGMGGGSWKPAKHLFQVKARGSTHATILIQQVFTSYQQHCAPYPGF